MTDVKLMTVASLLSIDVFVYATHTLYMWEAKRMAILPFKAIAAEARSNLSG